MIGTPRNRKKLDAIKLKGTNARMFSHPSAEPSGNARVLEADLSFQANMMTVTYRIDDDGALPIAELQLVEGHYQRLGLHNRYNRRARSHLASSKATIKVARKPWSKRPYDRRFRTRRLEPVNSWRPALYRAIAAHEGLTLGWLLTP